MLTAMFNSHSQILSPTEVPFVLYFYRAYHKKIEWTPQEIDQFTEEFCRLSERNLDLYFSPLSDLKREMNRLKGNLDFQALCRLIYLHFLPLKDKGKITTVIDKQIKYILYAEKIGEMIPGSKFLILVRDYRDVIISWKKRKLGSSINVAYIAKLWDIYYSEALRSVENSPERFLIIRYEDLVEDPESELRKILFFFNLSYSENMLKFNELYLSYINSMEEKAGSSYVEKVKDFHSNTLKPVNVKLSGAWKYLLTPSEVQTAQKVAGKTGFKFNYEIIQGVEKGLSISDGFAMIKAYWEKKIYLKLYILAPLWVKMIAKKFRPNVIHG